MTETPTEPDAIPEDPDESAESQPEPPDEPVSEPDVEGNRASATEPPA
jgi:hypothetical protein